LQKNDKIKKIVSSIRTPVLIQGRLEHTETNLILYILNRAACE